MQIQICLFHQEYNKLGNCIFLYAVIGWEYIIMGGIIKWQILESARDVAK
nr:MAG TPA: hypothetical protein [Bacteriophage sp.]